MLQDTHLLVVHLTQALKSPGMQWDILQALSQGLLLLPFALAEWSHEEGGAHTRGRGLPHHTSVHLLANERV